MSSWLVTDRFFLSPSPYNVLGSSPVYLAFLTCKCSICSWTCACRPPKEACQPLPSHALESNKTNNGQLNNAPNDGIASVWIIFSRVSSINSLDIIHPLTNGVMSVGLCSSGSAR